jgi:hypothetical protein
MRIISRVLPILLLGFFMLSIPANAQFVKLSDIKFPEVQTPDWKTGQSVTYAAKISGVPEVQGDVGVKFRIALVGNEMVEGQNFYWLEYDISDLKGLPPDAQVPFKVLKFKLLLKQIDPEAFNKDPKAMLKEIAAGKVVKKAIFQMDEQTPQMIDFMTVQGMMQGMTGQDMEKMIDELPIDQTKEDPNVKFDSKTGKETVTVPAGTFADAPFLWFSGSDETSSGEGKFHVHSKVPLFGLLKMAMNFNEKTAAGDKDKTPVNVKMNIDLANYEMTGAKSLITGEPVPFDFMQFMGGMSGGMGMGEEEEPAPTPKKPSK